MILILTEYEPENWLAEIVCGCQAEVDPPHRLIWGEGITGFCDQCQTGYTRFGGDYFSLSTGLKCSLEVKRVAFGEQEGSSDGQHAESGGAATSED